ncbi:hypothetical protein CSUI_004453 [Cystoisospora suis]|uniref:Uncharacterized protein n=1 Tax=Cystoisospora suis TaxID=483139 RepID=A0A2C6L1F8_9APIC|nr:hypothetical protein CSUI_004453 [Cystoisospora suis]
MSMSETVKHNSKPPPEDIERQLGLPATTISSQLTSTFLTAGFKHYQRSGMTTGNAPQNFEPIHCPPPHTRADGGCCYHLHKEVQPRRFSLMPRFFRFRDRLRNSSAPSCRFPSPAVSNLNFSGPKAPLSLPSRVPFPASTAGLYSSPFISDDYQHPARPLPSSLNPGRPAASQGDVAPMPMYAVEEQPSYPFSGNLCPAPPIKPAMEVVPFPPDGSRPVTQPPAVKHGEGVASPDHNGNLVNSVEGGSAGSHLVHSRGNATVRAPTSAPVPLEDPALLGSFQDRCRSKSLTEANMPQLGTAADPLGAERPFYGGYLPEARHPLSPYEPRGPLAGRMAWPTPRSWLSSNAFQRSSRENIRRESYPVHSTVMPGGQPDPRLHDNSGWEPLVGMSQPVTVQDELASAILPSVQAAESRRLSSPEEAGGRVASAASTGETRRFSGLEQTGGTEAGAWQYMVQED